MARSQARQRLLPALPRQAWVVLGSDFASAIGSGLTLPYLFIYAHSVRGLSYEAAGLVVATVALTSLAGNPVGGAAADRWNPRRALIAGLVLAAAGSVALALARTSPALFGAAGLTGFGVAVAWPAQDALLARLAGSAGRSAVFSVRHACLNAGLGLGALGAAATVSLSHPGTFTAVYLADAVTFLAVIPVLALLRLPGPDPAAPEPGAPEPGAPEPGAPELGAPDPGAADSETPHPARGRRAGYGQVLRDAAFRRVWLLTVLLVTIGFGQSQSSFAGYATRPGGINAHGLALAFAANTLTVVAASMFVLRALAGRRRTTAAALTAAAWAASWIVVITGGHLGSGVPAQVAFAAALAVFAIGEALLSPTLPAIINDLAPPHAAGRYNGLGTLAFTTGLLVGPAIGGAALGAHLGTGLFAALIVACAAAGIIALRLARHLPPAADHIPALGPLAGSIVIGVQGERHHALEDLFVPDEDESQDEQGGERQDGQVDPALMAVPLLASDPARDGR